jgi:hypothetical protein
MKPTTTLRPPLKRVAPPAPKPVAHNAGGMGTGAPLKRPGGMGPYHGHGSARITNRTIRR